ncbi:MAG: epoxide hydrolase [Methanoregula sp.]|nr:epoxide hydrolase [Methanoregula sp.]
MSPEPYTVKISEDTLHDMYERLAMTRWPDEISGTGWEYGTNAEYLKELTGYWQDGFNWALQEKAINHYSHFRAMVNGSRIHFIHEQAKGTGAIPLLLLHGWPATFTQMLKILPLLANPTNNEGDASDAFDVVVPSLPGFGFSDRPAAPGMGCARVAEILHTLMTQELGYRKYAIRASDIGAEIARHLAYTHPESIIGLHLSGATPLMGPPPADLAPEELQFLGACQQFMMGEMAYVMLHATKPQTLAFGLTDSPVGMAAWITEKFRAWSDCCGDIETRFTKDELLTNLTIYWATGTIGSSCRIYYETMRSPSPSTGQKITVPTGMAQFKQDLVPACRAWEERFYTLRHWTDMPRGGHFAEHEEPGLLAGDIREFFRALRRPE